MFKDYYLILGVSNHATSEEIEQAYKDADKRNNVPGFTSKEFHDVQEAFCILSDPELKIIYDKELETYNTSEDYDNYRIQNPRLANKISSLQSNTTGNIDETSGCGSKIAKGCMWVVIFVIVMMLQMCISAIMKQKGRHDVRNRYSYVIPKQQTTNHVYKLL